MNTCCHFPTYVDETIALSRLFRRVCLFFLVLSPQIAHAAGFLHARNQDIVDDAGQKIILRGVGLGNWLLPEGYMWRFGNTADRPRRIEKLISDLIGDDAAAQFWKTYRQTYITEADINRIAELGFNSVRPAINARLFMSEDKDAHFLDEGFELLDNLVRWCKASGIYVIIDMHAAPGGQTGQNIDDSADDRPLLFVEPKNQERLIRLWVEIAMRYKDEPAVAAYDLLNEPLPERTGAAAKYKDQLEPLYRRITQAIRQVDKRHIITLEGYDWANNWSVFTSRFDDNLLYQFHYYCWDNPTELKSIESYLTHRKRLGAPVWVGETGERDNAIYWATTEYFEANNIGWSFWPWKKMVATNGPYTINAPDGWDAIVAPTRNRDAKPPDKAQSQKVFDQLLQNIRLENCVYHPDVVNALFHRVPGRIEAENYSHQGAGKSYQLNPPTKNADRYRKSEPVPMVATNELASRRSPGQGIRLSAGEWTSYDVNSLESRTYDIVIKVKADQPAELRLSINDNRLDPAQKTSTRDKSWQELKLGKMKLEKGSNHLKLSVASGTASIDWLRFD
jgi:endoglucanase